MTSVTISAASITITSAVPDDPNLRIQVINNNANSNLQLISKGDYTLTGATIMAHKNLRFTCSSPGCKFTSTLSDIVTATAFTFPPVFPLGPGGVLSWDIDGPINIQTTNVHGGDSLEMESKSSSITLRCGGDVIPCKDPNQPPIPQVILDQCTAAGVPPIIFPCTPTFPDSASLRSVCIGAIVVHCNGGHKEKRFTAFTFIDMMNTFLESDEHVTFTCKTQDFRGHGMTIEAEQVSIRCPAGVDLSEARITLDKGLTVTATNCAAVPCINFRGTAANRTLISSNPLILTATGGIVDVCLADLDTPSGVNPPFPKLNNKTTPATYDTATVLFRNDLNPANQCGAGNGTRFNGSFAP
jgi:hypothetical protein